MSTQSSPVIDKLYDFVTNLILQNDYPGFEPRSFRVGLPEDLLQAGSKVFAQALAHENVYMKLTALRCFQDKPGSIKPHIPAVLTLLSSEDEWVRKESALVLERYPSPNLDIAQALTVLLDDSSVMVRREAAKALGKILAGTKEQGPRREEVIKALEEALNDSDHQVAHKVEKALRKAGHFSG